MGKIIPNRTLLYLLLSCIFLYSTGADDHTMITFSPVPLSETLFGVSMLEDRDGFLWFATLGKGLWQYDGLEFRQFDIYPENEILGLMEDSRGLIWISTWGNGVYCYNKEDNTFKHHGHIPDNPNSLSINVAFISPHLLCEDQDGNIWIGTSKGLNRYNPETGLYIRYYAVPDRPGTLSDSGIMSVYCDSENTVWVGTVDGVLNRYNKKNSTFSHFSYSGAAENVPVTGGISTILEDRSGALWVGTTNSGLYRFDKENFRFTRLFSSQNKTPGLGSDHILSLFEDDRERLWITHAFALEEGGLSMLNKERTLIFNYTEDESNSLRISSSQASDIIQDRRGSLWLISSDGKLDLYDKESHKFDLPRELKELMTGKKVDYIYEDSRGIIWICGYQNGLISYDRGTGSFNIYRHDPADPGSIPSPSVYCVFEDSDGTFWIGNGGGTLSIFDRETGRCTRHYGHDPADEESIMPNILIRQIIEDKDDKDILWLATYVGGVVKFNKKTGKAVNFRYEPGKPGSLSFHHVNSLFDDGKGKLWIASTYGLNLLDKKSGGLTYFFHDKNDPASIGSNLITEIFRDSAGRLWIGTQGGGLNLADEEKGTFKRVIFEKRIPVDSAAAILEDEKGTLWISTENGIIHFDPRDDSFVHYSMSDGLPDNVFVAASRLRSRDNALWFGGFHGLAYFHPDRVRSNQFVPPVYITSLSQGGTPMRLTKAVEKVTEITLDWQRPFFEFEFASLNLTNPRANRYAYMLEGIDETWFYSGAKRFGRYSNLPGGTYKLVIKGSNNHGLWNHQGTSLTVHVTSPFWRSWWFYSSIVAGILLLIALLVFFYLREMKARNEAELLAHDMELARQIQTAILPDCSSHAEYDIKATMLTADSVGGDYYDIVYGSDGALWISIGDVSGHGITAGLIMMIASTVHATITANIDFSPSEAVCLLNKMLYQSVRERLNTFHFMTFSTLKHEGNGEFVFSGAHLDMILYRKKSGSFERIETPGGFLIVMPDISKFTKNNRFKMDRGDTLILYTDGLTEAFDSRKKMLDMDGFVEIIKTHIDKDTTGLRDSIINDVLKWSNNTYKDDMSLIVVRRI